MKNFKNFQSLPTKQQIKGEILRRSYYQFFKEAFKVLHPQEDFKDNWHIKYLCDVIQDRFTKVANKEKKQKDLIICIPPRSLKSMIVTILSTAWTWTFAPHLKFITASYSNELSIEHAVKTRRVIESDWYREMYSDKFHLTTDQNVKSLYENDKTGSRRATSVGGTVTGGGADIIICDDPMKVQESNSELALQTAYDWWTQTMFSRLNNQETGLRLIVMQRLNDKDLVGRMIKENQNYEVINIPAELSDNVEPKELKDNYVDNLFFPTNFSREVLENARKMLGSMQYASQYMQASSPMEGNIIKAHWFKTFTPNEELKGLARHFRTDTAYGKEGSDNTATICYSKHNGNLYIWNIWKANLQFPDFIRAYKQYLSSNGYTNASRCLFEPKATGISVIQTLKNDGNINVIEGETPKDSKETRTQSASPFIESGKVYLLEYSEWIDSFIYECTVFPNGEHDDQLDVLTAIINEEFNNKAFGFVFS